MPERVDSLRAMVLAAGFGTRLQPLSLRIPKPLIPLLARPLLDLILERIFTSGISTIGVNAHHLRDQIRSYVRHHPKRDRLALFEETEILGTGGALDNARSFLEDCTDFILHNGDVVCNLDLDALVARHRQTRALVTLVLVHEGPEAKVLLTEDGRVVSLADKIGATTASSTTRCTYSGIAAFSRRFLQFIPHGSSSLIDALVRAIHAHPDRVRGVIPANLYWNDVGTFERYFRAQRDALSANIPHFPTLKPEFLAEQGSDRQFIRLRSKKKTFVLMLTPPEDPEFTRFVKLATFLDELDLGPAKLIAHHTPQHAVLMEDLGDKTLFRLTRQKGKESSRNYWLKKAVALLVGLQTRGTQKARSVALLWTRRLDFEQLRWESKYFSKYFIKHFLGLDVSHLLSLTTEFDRLAVAVAQQPQVLIHRDYQSTNLLVQENRLRMVDFQGARFGPIAYDLASLLLDPYNSIPPATTKCLLDYFRRHHARHGIILLSAQELEVFFLQAGLQRLMQALGAYGFLALEKHKHFFTRFMRPGLDRLQHILTRLASDHPDLAMPELRAVADTASNRLTDKGL